MPNIRYYNFRVIHFLKLKYELFQILHAGMNLTTNEMFNYKRYGYLKDKKGKYSNPFSRGPLINLFEFFFCAPDPGYGLFDEDPSI